jgi:uncharacterized delta-60 repeat protein
MLRSPEQPPIAPFLATAIVAAFCFLSGTTAHGQFANHVFEKLGLTIQAIQRPDGNIWVIYEQPLDSRDVVDRFDVPRLLKTALVTNDGERIPGSDRLFETGNRFFSGIFAMAVQPDNKLLLGTVTGKFFRLNADGSLDTSFAPQLSNAVGAIAVQPDGKILAFSDELVRLNPDGSRDFSFNSQLTGGFPFMLGLQSTGQIIVSLVSPPYLKRLNSDGSIDSTFKANLSAAVDSALVLPDDAILIRRLQNPEGKYIITLNRLNPDGSADTAFHPDPRFYRWLATQNDGKVLASFRDTANGDFFLGRMNPDGTLDSSFQTYLAGQPPGDVDLIPAVFVEPDGTIVAGIVSPTEGEQFLRFSSSGELEPGPAAAFKIPATVGKLAAQLDGKLVVAGDFNFVDHVRSGSLIRMGSDGNTDAGFHPLTFVSSTTAIDLDLQSGDQILFSALSGNDTVKMRLSPDGSLDSSFALQNLGPLFKARSDDKIVTGDFSNVVNRLLGDGNVDPLFSPTQVQFGGNQGNQIVAFAHQPDGKIIIAGNGVSFAGIHSVPVRAGVVRVNADGGLDTSFNPPSFPLRTRFNCVAVQPDGKILLGGRFSLNDGSGIANLIRLNPNGSIDHTLAAVPDYTVSATLVEETGAVVIGGGFSNISGQSAPRVARLLPNGQLDQSFVLDTRGGSVYALALLADGRIVAGGDFGLAATPLLPSSRVTNFSTRMFVDTGDNALIGGIIITGTGEKNILVRAIGPSLRPAGISDPLEDPSLELHDSNGAVLASNDDWEQSTNKQAVIDTTIPPTDPHEAAIVATLPANGANYTAVVRPARGAAGIGLVEVYDLDPNPSSSTLANFSTRGNVFPGDRALISGFIVTGPPEAGPMKVLVRALGPEIPLPAALQDPTLELHQDSITLAVNDDWKQTQRLAIEETTIPPTDDRESAMVRFLSPASSFSSGAYTAIIRGKTQDPGIGLLEIYNLSR